MTDATIVSSIGSHRAASQASWFEGTVHELELYDPKTTAEGGSMVWAVWFDRASRSKPHAHSFDQLLHVTEGEGILATEAAAGARSCPATGSPSRRGSGTGTGRPRSSRCAT